MRANVVSPMSEEKFQMNMENDGDDQNQLIRSRFLARNRSWRWTSLILPCLLGVFILIGTILLFITVSRWNTCRRQQVEQVQSILGFIPNDVMKTWTPCVETGDDSCVCPATFVRSSSIPSHCIPEHSRCLKSCKKNVHCACYSLTDAGRCQNATRNWIDNEIQISRLERFRPPVTNPILQFTWMDQFSRQLERLLVDTRRDERLFLSTDRRTGVAIHQEHDDYLLNERWSKVEINTTRQHIVYTQLNPQTHSCRMSAVRDDGSVAHGPIHTCPGQPLGAPYYLGVACSDILVLWHGSRHFKVQRKEGWAITRHHFEAVIPHLPVLLDPFHRYYSLYPDSILEIKDLSGNVIGQLVTDVKQPTRFEFLDQFGTIFIANTTHMQTFRSTNQQAWLDF